MDPYRVPLPPQIPRYEVVLVPWSEVAALTEGGRTFTLVFRRYEPNSES